MYLDFYGLAEHPFHVTPDPHFIFWTEQHRDALDHLLYGITERKGFVELTGEVGTGKTTLCRVCLEELGEEVDTALVLNPFLSEEQLLRALIADFGLSTDATDLLSCIQALYEFLLARHDAGRTVVVFIDEAQNLPLKTMEQLRLLSNFETDQAKLLQVVLCGQPELRQRLRQPELRQLRQRISVRFTLGPLNEQDTARYIGHRLAIAASGAMPKIEFTEAAIWMIYGHSRGCPRLINALVDHSLIAGYVNQSHVIDQACLHRAIAQLEGDHR